MARMRRDGRTLQEIGDYFNVSRQAVHLRLQRLSLPSTKPCTGCGKPIRFSTSSGRCGKFQCQYTPSTNPHTRTSPAERFEKFVSPPNKDGHQRWQGFINPVSGYGIFKWGGRGSNLTAHSAALMLRDGLDEPPGGYDKVACHKKNCHYRDCVAEAHVEWGTQDENVNGDGHDLAPRKQFDYTARHEQRYGHTPDWRKYRGSGRQCRLCNNDRCKARYRRQKAAIN